MAGAQNRGCGCCGCLGCLGVLLLFGSAVFYLVFAPPIAALFSPVRHYWIAYSPEWSNRVETTWAQWQVMSGEIPETGLASDDLPPPLPAPPPIRMPELPRR